MAITLNWVNKNPNTTNIKIYRGTTQSNLTPLTTLSSSATTYTDNTAVNNVLYYYQINVVVNALDEIPGSVLPMARYLDTGPGPKELVRGNWEWGFFGTLTTSEFLSNTDLTTVMTFGSAYNALSGWYKLACQGKVIYVPNSVPRYFNGGTPLADLNAIYAAGALYGTGDNGKPYAGLTGAIATPVPQNKKLVYGSYEFYFRLPKGAATLGTDQAIPYSTGGTPVYEVGFSEASMIASLNANWTGYTQYIVKRLAPCKLYGNNGTSGITGTAFLTQHWAGSGLVVTGSLSGSATTVSAATNSAGSSTMYVVPVLELIPA